MEYYSDFEKKEILPFAKTWKNLGDIILRERSSFFLLLIIIPGMGLAQFIQ